MTKFQQPKVTNIQLFLRGLLGTKLFSEEDDWFVIIGSHSSITKAKEQADLIGLKKYKAKIYEPSAGSGYYTVVIGTNLNFADAKELRTDAIKNGLADDTYLLKRK